MPILDGIAIREQNLPFMFEVWETAAGEPSETFILPLPPESYRISTPTRASVSQTMAGAFEDNIGLGLSRISLQGTFGYLGSLPGGGGKTVNGVQMCGWDLFKELEGMFRGFYQRFGAYLDSGEQVAFQASADALPVLRFYNFTDEDFFEVQVNKFDFLRNTQRKMLYQYDIQMTTLRRLIDGESVADRLFDDLAAFPELDDTGMSLWETLLTGYTTAYSGMSTIINQVGQIRQNLSTLRVAVTGFRNQISSFIAAPFGLISDTVKTIDTVLAVVVSLDNIPHEFTALLRSTKRDLLRLSLQPDKFQVSYTSTGTVTSSSAAKPAVEILTGPLPSPQVSAANGVVSMDVPETTLFGATIETARDVASSEEPINSGDTLETLAFRTLGDSREWQRIATLNGLEHPYIVKDPLDAYTPKLASGVLTSDYDGGRSLSISGMIVQAGDVLVVSAAGVVAEGSVESVADIVTLAAPLSGNFPAGTTVTRHERRLNVALPGDKLLIPGTRTGVGLDRGDTDFAARLYGTDESLDDAGDHPADTAGDVATVSGLRNLEMQLGHALRTTQGELAQLGHPEYGSYLPKIIGRIGTDYWHERSRVEARMTMLRDPRVKRVGKVSFVTSGTAIHLTADVYPINQSSPTRMNIVVNG